MQLEKVRIAAGKVDGWLDYGEGETLYRLAKQCQGRGAIVEVGSWKGKSTIWLAGGSEEGSKTKITAIDPHIGSAEHQSESGSVWTFDEFQANLRMAGIERLVIPLVKTSEDAARAFKNSVELVFIDGAH